jgi:hypothetical protein
MDIRNRVQALQRLRGCRVVEGFVRVVLIDRANQTDYNGFSFPELHEITDYLLVYRVAGLTSLGQLFPNLTVIRGNSLFVDYGLVVYEMFQLQVRKHLVNVLAMAVGHSAVSSVESQPTFRRNILPPPSLRSKMSLARNSLGSTGFLDFIHRPEFIIQKNNVSGSGFVYVLW